VILSDEVNTEFPVTIKLSVVIDNGALYNGQLQTYFSVSHKSTLRVLPTVCHELHTLKTSK